jgi:hypothetical protein
VLRLDFLMEHMRVDPKAVQNWRLENIDIPGRASDLDASYAVLFDRYKRSDMPDVKYTAEYQSFRLGAQPDLQLWLDMLARPVDKKYLAIAQEIVGKVATHEIETEGPEFKDPDRDRLLAFALSPEPVNPDLLPSPQQRLRPENIRRLQSSSRFGLVDVGFGSGVMGQSGYSMLFERRGKRWVFLFVTKGWIS